MGLINIFGGDGVLKFVLFFYWMILIDSCERSVAGLMRFISSP